MDIIWETTFIHDLIIFKTIVKRIFLVAFHLSAMFTRMTFISTAELFVVRRVHAKSSTRAPNKKRHLCVPEPSGRAHRLHHILGAAFCTEPQLLIRMEARGAPSIHWHSGYTTHTHTIVYWLGGGTGRAEQRQNRLLCTPTISLLAAVRTIFLGWRRVCALDARPCRARCTTTTTTASRQGLHCYTLCSERASLFVRHWSRREGHNTCTAHSLSGCRGTSWKTRNTLRLCIQVQLAQGCTHFNDKWGCRSFGVCQVVAFCLFFLDSIGVRDLHSR
jgi:hypothetical protein